MSFQELLFTSRASSFAAVDLRQRIRHAAGERPDFVQKWLRKYLWRTSMRHMPHVLPGVEFQPLAGRSWKLRLRNKNSPEFVSRPLAELREFTGRPAIVIATGPSANNYDWSGLVDGRRLIWAVNGGPTMLAKNGLRCDFLVISDHRFAREGADHIALAVDQGAALLLTHEAAAGFAAARPDVMDKARFYIFEKANRWYGLPILGPAELVAMNDESGRPYLLPESVVAGVGWSRDPMMGVFAGKTVTFTALQLVVWSGSRMIEVVGMDLGGAGHAYHEATPVVSHLEKDYRQVILPSFQCMAADLADSGLRMVNHSPSCPLPKELFNWERPAS